jgi:hypothetical protein
LDSVAEGTLGRQRGATATFILLFYRQEEPYERTEQAGYLRGVGRE